MYKNISGILSLCLVGLLAQCKGPKLAAANKPVIARISSEGFLSCFENGLKYSNNNCAWCEASAILYDGTNLFFANDKDMPDARSSVFYWPFRHGFADTSGPATYLMNPLYKTGKKFEDFALTPNGRYIFLSTAFDRYGPDSKALGGYNTIYYWGTGQQDKPHILSMGNPTDSNSVSIRRELSKALVNTDFPQSMPYFKIEGLAATNDMLYFGVREQGKKYDDFTYQCKILTVGYGTKNGTVQLVGGFRLLADIDIPSLQPSLKKPLGLSSIEYDRFNNRFLILTSYEDGEHLGGYLWTATLDQLKLGTIELVRDGRGVPIYFEHKPEDIAVINRHKVIVVHDDDRIATSVKGQTRQPFQCAYSIIEFK